MMAKNSKKAIADFSSMEIEFTQIHSNLLDRFFWVSQLDIARRVHFFPSLNSLWIEIEDVWTRKNDPLTRSSGKME